VEALRLGLRHGLKGWRDARVIRLENSAWTFYRLVLIYINRNFLGGFSARGPLTANPPHSSGPIRNNQANTLKRALIIIIIIVVVVVVVVVVAVVIHLTGLKPHHFAPTSLL
jgi:hypothetical protein